MGQEGPKLNVYKFALPVELNGEGTARWADSFVMNIQTGARLLTTDATALGVYLYALVDPDQELEPRFFRMVQTGAEFTVRPGFTLEPVGTFATQDRNFVLHLFEEKKVGFVN